MWITMQRSILRMKSKFMRFYSLNLENLNSINILDKNIYDDEILDQSWNATNIRSDNIKSLRIAILGMPNAGKSTLINRLVGRPICPVSSKVQTTQVKCNAIYVEGDTQLIFIDTPGVVTNNEVKKYQLQPSFITDIDKALRKADIVGVLHDVSHKFNATVIDKRVLTVLNRLPREVTSLLILNKIDKVKKKANLLKTIDILTSEKGWPNFSDIFMISALEADGVDDLRKYLIDLAKPRDWEYKHDTISDESKENIIQNTVRAKFMDYLPQEMPYEIKIKTEHVGILPDGSMSAIVNIKCPSDRICKVVMGKKGTRIKTVALLAEQDLCQAFGTAVRLKIAVQFSKPKEEAYAVKNQKS